MTEQMNDWTTKWMSDELGRGNSGIVVLEESHGGKLMAVKIAASPEMDESIQREIKILKMMNHLLIVRILDCSFGAIDRKLAVVTEFVPNGSLADHLSDAKNGDFCQLSGSTRIVRIIVRIVLAMRYIHSHNVIHCDLIPQNILLDWDWNVRICDFVHSVVPDSRNHSPPNFSNENQCWPSVASRYLAPECYEDVTFLESDVFSFGMILYELIIGRPLFSKTLSMYQVISQLIKWDWSPYIPESVIPETAELIRDCIAIKHEDRPSFIEILKRLKKIQFKLMTDVNSAKITAFVDEIEKWETDNPKQTFTIPPMTSS
jgi:serine/threonine protein kinase